jgi:hypothetical protein
MSPGLWYRIRNYQGTLTRSKTKSSHLAIGAFLIYLSLFLMIIRQLHLRRYHLGFADLFGHRLEFVRLVVPDPVGHFVDRT